MTDPMAALRMFLGPDVGIGQADPAARPDDLWPDETAAITRAIPARQTEFAAGRRAARAAMTALGLPVAAIPQGADRAPLWPAGLVGSITHCTGLCLAVLAHRADLALLGLDAEPATPLDPDLTPIICTGPERDWCAAQPDPGLAAKQIFCAKEAVYKAQFPATGRVIGFDAVTLTVTGDRFAVAGDLPPLAGRIATGAAHIIATCTSLPAQKVPA